jgi:hypothetical protein
MATDNYIGIPFRQVVGGDLNISTITTGTSATAANFFEFRWQSDTGSGATGVIRDDALLALEVIRNFILSGGSDRNGAGVPPTSI